MKRPEREKPIFPKNNPFRKSSDERGVSPVIAVILMVAITVVLAAVLFVLVQNLIDINPPTPRGSLSFTEDNQGTYTGTFDGSVPLKDIEFSVYDASKLDTIILRPSKETVNSIPGGLNITFKDLNENDDLDAIDLILIQGGQTDDKISIAHKPSGGTVATKVLQ
jgi:flagellin-like protein